MHIAQLSDTAAKAMISIDLNKIYTAYNPDAMATTTIQIAQGSDALATTTMLVAQGSDTVATTTILIAQGSDTLATTIIHIAHKKMHSAHYASLCQDSFHPERWK